MYSTGTTPGYSYQQGIQGFLHCEMVPFYGEQHQATQRRRLKWKSSEQQERGTDFDDSMVPRISKKCII